MTVKKEVGTPIKRQCTRCGDWVYGLWLNCPDYFGLGICGTCKIELKQGQH